MKRKYRHYNDQLINELNSIDLLIRSNKIYYAKKELLNFMKKNPGSIKAKFIYLDILIKLEEYEEALELGLDIVKYSEMVYYKVAVIYKELNQLELAEKHFLDLYLKYNDSNCLKKLIEIAIKQNNIDKAYKYFMMIDEDFIKNNKHDYIILKRYIYKYVYSSLNEVILEDDSYSLSEKQVVRYDEDKAKNKFKKIYKNKIEMDTDELFDSIKDLIKYEDCNTFDIYDRYIIYMPSIVKEKYKYLSYFCVRTIINTNDIVDVKPCTFYGKKSINGEIISNDNVYVKKMSRIDKFNKKYGLI